MKKISFFIVGIFAGLSVTAFAASIPGLPFTDETDFADWFKESVQVMSDTGVIRGFPDGSFKPSEKVDRAQLAVMLNRFRTEILEEARTEALDMLTEKIEEAFLHYDKLKDSDLTHKFKVALVMAESDLKKMEKAPEMTYLKEITNPNLPQGYTLYERIGIVYTYYLHFKGSKLEGDVVMEHDDWYGPFFAN